MKVSIIAAYAPSYAYTLFCSSCGYTGFNYVRTQVARHCVFVRFCVPSRSCISKDIVAALHERTRLTNCLYLSPAIFSPPITSPSVTDRTDERVSKRGRTDGVNEPSQSKTLPREPRYGAATARQHQQPVHNGYILTAIYPILPYTRIYTYIYMP